MCIDLVCIGTGQVPLLARRQPPAAAQHMQCSAAATCLVDGDQQAQHGELHNERAIKASLPGWTEQCSIVLRSLVRACRATCVCKVPDVGLPHNAAVAQRQCRQPCTWCDAARYACSARVMSGRGQPPAASVARTSSACMRRQRHG